MDSLLYSSDQRRGRTMRRFLLKSETKSAACDGQNGTHLLRGLVLAPQKCQRQINKRAAN